MASMKFYSGESMSEERMMKINLVPLTNSACESNLGDLTYAITRSAGSNNKIETFSNKNLIRKKIVFQSTKWKNKSVTERVAKWKWAKNSPQAKKVRKIGLNYLESVKAMKIALLAEKEKKMRGKQAKELDLLERCKLWGGPVTEKSLHSLEKLDDDQLLVKVRYLRATISPNIREKRKEGNKMIRDSSLTK